MSTPPLLLHCPVCPRRDNRFGELVFDGSFPAFVFRCKRGHMHKIRALTAREKARYRDEHKSAPPPFVATPWEGV